MCPTRKMGLPSEHEKTSLPDKDIMISNQLIGRKAPKQVPDPNQKKVCQEITSSSIQIESDPLLLASYLWFGHPCGLVTGIQPKQTHLDSR